MSRIAWLIAASSWAAPEKDAKAAARKDAEAAPGKDAEAGPKEGDPGVCANTAADASAASARNLMRTNLRLAGVIYTIGHSTRTLEEFVRILHAYEIRKLIDIRTVPRSATNPQFNRETLPPELSRAGIVYEHWPALGGLRKAHADSRNTGWKNASFRGYADYMQTEAFASAIDRLIAEAKETRACIMCAEAVPWRCHRNLVADALAARGIEAIHILNLDKSQLHRMTSFAKVSGRMITYPAL